MDLGNVNLPITVALAFIAVVGYLFGRRSGRALAVSQVDELARREVKRARAVARELEAIAGTIRKNLATHHVSLGRFKERMSKLTLEDRDDGWAQLCRDAEEVVKPTLRLAAQIAQAYDEIRQQSNLLMSFTEIRTDPLTRVSNRRAMDESLETMFSRLRRYGEKFSVAIFDIDHFKKVNDEMGHLYGDRTLQAVAQLIDESVRDTDIVARYGGEEFVVMMPHTALEGACTFSERLRHNVEKSLDVTISGGVATADPGDAGPAGLLTRADAALYAAKAAGRNCVFSHGGNDVAPVSLADELLAPQLV